MIIELQESVKMLNQSQERMINYIQSLKDSIIKFSDNEDGTTEQKKSKRIAKKIKRKRQKKRKRKRGK